MKSDDANKLMPVEDEWLEGYELPFVNQKIK